MVKYKKALMCMMLSLSVSVQASTLAETIDQEIAAMLEISRVETQENSNLIRAKLAPVEAYGLCHQHVMEKWFEGYRADVSSNHDKVFVGTESEVRELERSIWLRLRAFEDNSFQEMILEDNRPGIKDILASFDALLERFAGVAPPSQVAIGQVDFTVFENSLNVCETLELLNYIDEHAPIKEGVESVFLM